MQPPVPPVAPPQAVTSLHSSNDSGFSNEPPVQPDIDYSDDEAMRWAIKFFIANTAAVIGILFSNATLLTNIFRQIFQVERFTL